MSGGARVLIIGPDEQAAIDLLKAHAATRVMDAETTAKAIAADAPGFRQMMRRFSLPLPVGFVVTYTHERQPDPRLGVVQHISVSVDTPNKYPSVEAIEMILAAFGMAPIKDAIRVWPEAVEPGLGAVNVVQFLPGRGPSQGGPG
jgi:hypothetical protein